MVRQRWLEHPTDGLWWRRQDSNLHSRFLPIELLPQRPLLYQLSYWRIWQGRLGIEPTQAVLETASPALEHSPLYGDPYQTWTGVLLCDRQAWYSSSPMGHITPAFTVRPISWAGLNFTIVIKVLDDWHPIWSIDIIASKSLLGTTDDNDITAMSSRPPRGLEPLFSLDGERATTTLKEDMMRFELRQER